MWKVSHVIISWWHQGRSPSMLAMVWPWQFWNTTRLWLALDFWSTVWRRNDRMLEYNIQEKPIQLSYAELKRIEPRRLTSGECFLFLGDCTCQIASTSRLHQLFINGHQGNAWSQVWLTEVGAVQWFYMVLLECKRLREKVANIAVDHPWLPNRQLFARHVSFFIQPSVAPGA